jgi:hypothetical protein
LYYDLLEDAESVDQLAGIGNYLTSPYLCIFSNNQADVENTDNLCHRLWPVGLYLLKFQKEHPENFITTIETLFSHRIDGSCDSVKERFNATMAAMNLPTAAWFPKFGQLPVELRKEIWELLTPERTIRVDEGNVQKQILQADGKIRQWINPRARASADVPIPPLFLVCKESYNAAKIENGKLNVIKVKNNVKFNYRQSFKGAFGCPVNFNAKFDTFVHPNRRCLEVILLQQTQGTTRISKGYYAKAIQGRLR